MARTARVKKDANGTAHYHLMSQANDKKFLFEEGHVKDSLIDALKRAAEFSGIGLEAYAGMDNHFHVVCATFFIKQIKFINKSIQKKTRGSGKLY